MKIPRHHKTENRRSFLVDGCRAAVATMLGLLGVFLGWKRHADPDKMGSCPFDLVCRSCSRIGSCQEPLAIWERDNLLTTGESP